MLVLFVYWVVVLFFGGCIWLWVVVFICCVCCLFGWLFCFIDVVLYMYVMVVSFWCGVFGW